MLFPFKFTLFLLFSLLLFILILLFGILLFLISLFELFCISFFEFLIDFMALFNSLLFFCKFCSFLLFILILTDLFNVLLNCLFTCLFFSIFLLIAFILSKIEFPFLGDFISLSFLICSLFLLYKVALEVKVSPFFFFSSTIFVLGDFKKGVFGSMFLNSKLLIFLSISLFLFIFFSLLE